MERLSRQLDEKTAIRDKLVQIAREEADGTGGSGKRNAGPIYRIKKADADRVEAELMTLKERTGKLLVEKQMKLDSLEVLTGQALGSVVRTPIDGPAARMEALSRLTKKSETMQWTSIFIILLFIAIETAPVFTKIISNKGPYDHLLRTVEYRFETDALKNKALIHAEVKKRSEKLADTEKAFISESLDIKLNST